MRFDPIGKADMLTLQASWTVRIPGTRHSTPPLEMKGLDCQICAHGGIVNLAGAIGTKVRIAVPGPERCQALVKTLPYANISGVIGLGE
jgi:hypothetical protein